MKKIIKKDKKVSGMILEDLDSKLDLVLEGHAALDLKIDKNHQETNEKFEIVNEKLEMVFDELHLIRNELKEKIGRDEFIVLEKRVAALEKKRGA